MIKSTQLKATYYHYSNHLQWISYNDLTNIKKISENEFATLYKATWLNGYKDDGGYKRISEDTPVALKKLHNSQNISNEFLNEVNYFVFLFISGFLNIIIVAVIIKYFIYYLVQKLYEVS